MVAPRDARPGRGFCSPLVITHKAAGLEAAQVAGTPCSEVLRLERAPWAREFPQRRSTARFLDPGQREGESDRLLPVSPSRRISSTQLHDAGRGCCSDQPINHTANSPRSRTTAQMEREGIEEGRWISSTASATRALAHRYFLSQHRRHI